MNAEWGQAKWGQIWWGQYAESLIGYGFSDSITFLDSVTQGEAGIILRNLSDNITFGEIQLGLGLGFRESITFAEATFSFYTFAYADTISILDQLIYANNLLKDFSETLTLSDTVALQKLVGRILNDNLQLSDQILLRLVYSLAKSDQLTVTDFLRILRSYLDNVGDSVTLADHVSIGLFTNLTRSVSDSMSLVDAISTNDYDNDYIRRYLNDVPRSN